MLTIQNRHIAIATAFICSMLSLICALAHGPGLTHDSGAYVYAAASLAETGMLKDHFGNPLVMYPPLYSFILSGAYLLQINVFLYASILNAVSLAGVILVVHYALEKIFNDRLFYCLTLFWIAFSAPVFMNSVFLWSDMIYILITFLSINAMTKFVGSGSRTYLILAALLASYSVLQRIIGVTLLVAEGLFLLFFMSVIWKDKIRNTVIYSVTGLIPLLGWIVRNHLTSGAISNQYDPAGKTVWKNTTDYLDVLSSFIIPDEINFVWRITGLGLFSVVCFLYFKIKLPRSSWMTMLLLFLGSYTVIFIFLDSVYYICDFDDRYLSPAYISLIVLFFAMAKEVLNKSSHRLLLLFPLLILSVVPLLRTGKNFIQVYRDGAGYNSLYWQNHPAIVWAGSNLAGKDVISDNPMPFILLCDPGFSAPATDPERYRDIPELYFISWKLKDNRLSYIQADMNAYRSYFLFEEIKSFEDCTVYLLRKKNQHGK